MTVNHLPDKSTDPEVIDCARPSTAWSALRKLEPKRWQPSPPGCAAKGEGERRVAPAVSKSTPAPSIGTTIATMELNAVLVCNKGLPVRPS